MSLLAQADVAVLGADPAGTFAALLLAEAGLRPVQVALPNARMVSRSTVVNPQVFQLHPMLHGGESKLKLWPGHGLRFLGDSVDESMNTAAAKPMVYVGDSSALAAPLEKMRKSKNLAFASPRSLAVEKVDEAGVVLRLDQNALAVRAVLAAEVPDAAAAKALSLPIPSDGQPHQPLSILRLPASAKPQFGKPPTLPMSLDLAGTGGWAWLLPAAGGAQAVVLHPGATVDDSLLDRWLEVLELHGVLTLGPAERKAATRETIFLPVAGALRGETVANRTLLIGTAGGFISACGESFYPALWSAKLAVSYLASSLPKPFLQDHLTAFPQTWGATLGDYLRGPQQNLKFLLPLVYRNAVMARRLSDSVLIGQSVVR